MDTEAILTTLSTRLSELFNRGCTLRVYNAASGLLAETLVLDNRLLVIDGEQADETDEAVMWFRPIGLWRTESGWDWHRARALTVDLLSQAEEFDDMPATERQGYPAWLPAAPDGLRLFGPIYHAVLAPDLPLTVDWAQWQARRDEVLADESMAQAWQAVA